MIKAILTDLDGVIRRWDPEIIERAEDTAGLPRDALRNTAFESQLLLRATTGQITDACWRREIAHRLRRKFPAADAAEAVRQWSRSPGEIDTDVLDLLRRCRAGARLVLITNATTRLETDLDRLGIDQAFDHVVNSSSVGHVKPQAEIFDAALDLLDIETDEVFFVDDRAENVIAAAGAGINGHHFRTLEGLKRALARFGLPV